MAETDFINALGAGATFNTKTIVEALVNAERAPAKARIETRIANSEATISAWARLYRYSMYCPQRQSA